MEFLPLAKTKISILTDSAWQSDLLVVCFWEECTNVIELLPQKKHQTREQARSAHSAFIHFVIIVEFFFSSPSYYLLVKSKPKASFFCQPLILLNKHSLEISRLWNQMVRLGPARLLNLVQQIDFMRRLRAFSTTKFEIQTWKNHSLILCNREVGLLKVIENFEQNCEPQHKSQTEKRSCLLGSSSQLLKSLTRLAENMLG